MEKSLQKMLDGYHAFREKYAEGAESVMRLLSKYGQQPETMVIACCDSRVDPALILQCDPGDLFVVRNVANIVPPYENDESHHGTSAALEFGITKLQVKHLIVLGHSECGGIQALLRDDAAGDNDFIGPWVTLVKNKNSRQLDHPDEFAKEALLSSYKNLLTFPWIKQRCDNGLLKIHLWFFDIKHAQLYSYSFADQKYCKLGDV